MKKPMPVAKTPAEQPAAPNSQIQVTATVALEEELLAERALTTHFRNRNLALAQMLANLRGE